MSWLAWIVLGLIAGALARLVMPGRDPGGLIITIVIGILGALIGGFVGRLLGLGDVDAIDLGSLALAVLGSVILLALYRTMRGRRV